MPFCFSSKSNSFLYIIAGHMNTTLKALIQDTMVSIYLPLYVQSLKPSSHPKLCSIILAISFSKENVTFSSLLNTISEEGS